MKKRIISIIIVIFILLAFATTVTIDWLYNTFGHLTIDEIIFHLKVPLEGTNTDLISKFFKDCAFKVLIPTLIISIILIYPMVKDLKVISKVNTSESKKIVIVSLIISISIFFISTFKIIKTTDIVQYIKSQIDNSNFIQKEYTKPEKVAIKFPEKKRNLIYIFIESMESTYYSKEDGGFSENDLIPEISKLAKENINFSNTDKLGGAYCLNGTTWTVGGMLAQTAGVPLKISIEKNSMDQYSSFISGAYSIGQVLEKNNYNNYLLLGSDASFGGRRNLFTQHGNYEIWDFISAQEENRVNEKVWWGYSDKKLFEFAKEKIIELSRRNKPFNFTMLTADTHFYDGYLCEDCEEKWDLQYKNVISCSSKRVGEFINWIKHQDFYNDTTIVIMGDHLTMRNNFFEPEEGQKYDKTVVSIIINSAINTNNNKNRKYSTMDMYPTTLAAMGASIDGNRLGLGTNLFSNEKTLIEKYGIDYINQELRKTSRFYNNQLLVSK